ncbi:MAG: DedA family protein [Caloramator sp.]|nr:DedA family protein [Caloramator sp.]
MEKFLIQYIKNTALTNPLIVYSFSFINAVLQILFPPYPGDTITIFQGYLISQGYLNAYFVLLSTLLGTYLSSLFLYFIGYKFGKSILLNKFIIKYFNPKKIYKFESWFKKYGSFIIIINKFLPGIGSLTFIAAGIFQLPPISASISIGIATIIHNTFIIMAGKLTGENVIIIKQALQEYNKIIIIASIIISLVYLYLKLFYKEKFDTEK